MADLETPGEDDFKPITTDNLLGAAHLVTEYEEPTGFGAEHGKDTVAEFFARAEFDIPVDLSSVAMGIAIGVEAERIAQGSSGPKLWTPE